MPNVNITTRDSAGPTPFTVHPDSVGRLVEQLGDPNAVLRIVEPDGTAYIPVRHVTAMWVVK